MKKTQLLTYFRLFVIVVFIYVPLAFALQTQKNTKNFRVVKEGVLYRSGQMSLDGIKRIIHDYGIRTVISLRDARKPGNPPPDADEQKECVGLGLHYLRITPHRWLNDQNGFSPADENVADFLELVRDPKKHPILVHCFAGIHRTGAYSAVYRISEEGWSKDSALAELNLLGYDNLYEEKDILGYLKAFKSEKIEKIIHERKNQQD